MSLHKGPLNRDFYAHYYHLWGFGAITHTLGIFTRTAGAPQAAGALIGSCLMAGQRVPLTRRKRHGGVAAKPWMMRQLLASRISRNPISQAVMTSSLGCKIGVILTWCLPARTQVQNRLRLREYQVRNQKWMAHTATIPIPTLDPMLSRVEVSLLVVGSTSTPISSRKAK